MSIESCLSVAALIIEISRNVVETIKSVLELSESHQKINSKKFSKNKYIDGSIRISMAVSCETINIKPALISTVFTEKLTAILPENLLYYETFSNNAVQPNRLKILGSDFAGETFRNISPAVINYYNAVIIKEQHNCKKALLQIDLLNIVPGNDRLCYRITYTIIHNLEETGIYKLFSSIISDIISQVLKTYNKFLEPVSQSTNRLMLEAQILNEKGYPDIFFREIDGGYGIKLPLHRRYESVLIKIPDNYPLAEPLIVLETDGIYTEVQLNTRWDSFFTVGHIMNALEERRC